MGICVGGCLLALVALSAPVFSSENEEDLVVYDDSHRSGYYSKNHK